MSDLAEKLIRNKQQGTATSPDDRIKIQSMDMIPEMQGHEGDVFYRALVRWIYLITDGEPKQRKQILKFCMKHMEELSGGSVLVHREMEKPASRLSYFLLV
jgi:uncharacterized protein YegL